MRVTRAEHVSIIKKKASEQDVDIQFTNASVDIDGNTVLCFRGTNTERVMEVISACSPYANIKSYSSESDGKLEVKVTMPSNNKLWSHSMQQAYSHPCVRMMCASAVVLLVGALGGIATLL
jgi:hypothetical protein